MKMRKLKFFLPVALLLGVIPLGIAGQSERAPDTRQREQFLLLGDQFFYVCVHEYFRGEALDKIDVSPNLNFEMLSFDFRRLEETSKAARAVAAAIHKEQEAAGEVAEGKRQRVAVLYRCLRASRDYAEHAD